LHVLEFLVPLLRRLLAHQVLRDLLGCETGHGADVVARRKTGLRSFPLRFDLAVDGGPQAVCEFLLFAVNFDQDLLGRTGLGGLKKADQPDEVVRLGLFGLALS
jgi:hypothetical protein